MKTKLFLIVIAGLLAAGTQASACMPSPLHPRYSDSLVIKPYYTGKKNVVRVYPNPLTSKSVHINSKTEGELHFYIFDVNGVLLYRSTLKGHEEKNIPDLRKGTYTYDVFANDESIEQGNIMVK